PLAAVTTRNPEQKGKPEGEENDANSEENNEENSENAPERRETEVELKEVVFVRNAENVARMVEVTTGISDYDNIEILSGVAEGDIVVSGPYLVVSKRLNDGDVVEAKEGNN